MNRIILALAFVLLSVVPSWAAWDSAVLKILEAQKDSVRCLVLITDSQANEVREEEFILPATSFSSGSLATAVQARVAALNAAASKSKALTPGAVISLTPPVVVPPDPPTPEQLAQQKFMADLQRWYRIKQAIDAGVLTGTEQEVTDFLALVQSEYKPSYVGGL